MQEINKLKGDRKTSPSPHLITRYRLGSRDGVIQREANHERNIEYRGQSRSPVLGPGSGVAGDAWCRDVRLLSLGTIITDPVVRPHAGSRLPGLPRQPDHRPQGRGTLVWSGEGDGVKHSKQRFNQKHRGPNCLRPDENKNNLRIY